MNVSQSASHTFGFGGRGEPLRVRVPDESSWRDQIRCQSACPVETDARAYVNAIERGDYESAYLIARAPNPFASICGRICGAPCEAACRRGTRDAPIAIRALKRFVVDRARASGSLAGGLDLLDGPNRTGSWTDAAALKGLGPGRLAAQHPATPHPVGIIGAGPAGLTAAHDLALLGYSSDVYEIETLPGGMFRVGIPAYRLPHDLVEEEIAAIEALGVRIHYGVTVGKDVTFEELRGRHLAILIATGAKRSRPISIPGHDLQGVYGGVEFLRRCGLGEHMTIGERVVVVGGGNVAYDVARSALRLQTTISGDIAHELRRYRGVKQVTVACLESRAEMPADEMEVYEGEEEGVVLLNQLGPKEFLGDHDGMVVGVQFMRCLSIFDDKGRFNPRFNDKDTVVVEADTVLLSIGQQADLSFLAESEVPRDPAGRLKVDQQSLACGAPGVFAAGDVALGPRLAIDAVASGKRAALSIFAFLSGKTVDFRREDQFRVLLGYQRERGYEKIPRQPLPRSQVADRVQALSTPVELGYSEETARREAKRCYVCAVNTIFDSDRCIACSGCVDVCPERCLALVSLERIQHNEGMEEILAARYGEVTPFVEGSAIVKDDARCTRCGLCALRCPTQAITMEELIRREDLHSHGSK